MRVKFVPVGTGNGGKFRPDEGKRLMSAETTAAAPQRGIVANLGQFTLQTIQVFSSG